MWTGEVVPRSKANLNNRTGGWEIGVLCDQECLLIGAPFPLARPISNTLKVIRLPPGLWVRHPRRKIADHDRAGPGVKKRQIGQRPRHLLIAVSPTVCQQASNDRQHQWLAAGTVWLHHQNGV